MARNEPKLVSGTVACYNVRRAVTGNWAHEYTVAGQVYTHFSEHDVALMRPGETVRFSATPKKRQKSRTSYFAIDEFSIEVQSTLAAHGADRGYIYVLVLPAMKGLRKIGFTRDTPQARADALSGSTGVPGKYRVEWSMAVSGDPHRIERAVHATLAKKRFDKEFFRVQATEAKQAIQLAYADLYPEAVAEIEQSLHARASSIANARKEAETRVHEEKARRAEEKRKASLEYKWLTSGTLVVRVLSMFTGPAIEEIHVGFLKRLFGAAPEKPARVSVEISGVGTSDGTRAWEIRINGWLSGTTCHHVGSASSLESAVQHLAFLRDTRPERMNISIRIATSLLDRPMEPSAGRLRADGLELHVHGREIADYQLVNGDLQAACAKALEIAGFGAEAYKAPAPSKLPDARRRPPYPFGSKARARELLKHSMQLAEIEAYLDDFAD